MPWESTTFERSDLYNQVWAEPMTKVAMRYGLSDVGLRKICIRLHVPVPPRGYWAKLAAGEAIAKTPLRKSEGASSYQRSVYVAPHSKELARRLVEAGKSTTPQPDTANYRGPGDLAELGPEAMQLAKATRQLKEEYGVFTFSQRAWADVMVSHLERERALRILDQLAVTVRAANGTFNLKSIPSEQPKYRNGVKQPPYDRGYLEFHQQRYIVRIKERILYEDIIDVPAPAVNGTSKDKKKMAPESSPMPKKYRLVQSGKLQLFVYPLGSTFETAKIEDTPATSLETKLYGFIQRLEQRSLRAKLEAQLRVEEALKRERDIALWQEQKRHKDGLLKKLESFERLARDLDRAESLRRFANRIEGSPNASKNLKENLPVLAHMADWLDPLVAKHWPEVDDVPDAATIPRW